MQKAEADFASDCMLKLCYRLDFGIWASLRHRVGNKVRFGAHLGVCWMTLSGWNKARGSLFTT